jgi:hypothetical protein
MNQKEISKKLKPFTSEQLEKEIEIRKRKKKGKVLGYRAILFGDEYNYGQYQDSIIAQQYPSRTTKEECKAFAERQVKESKNGGCVEEIFKDTPKFPGKIG